MNKHKPVLLNEAIEYLNLSPGKVVIDATYGYGGHSKKILEKIKPGGKLLAIDRDWESYNDCANLAKSESLLLCAHGNFRELSRLAKQHQIAEADGILFDLGFSTPQVRSALRGFSFLEDGPLDMRMDVKEKLTASEIVNNWDERELSRIFREYGEERFAKSIAKAITVSRKEKSIDRTLQLVEIIKKAVPAKCQHQKIHFATRVFQALRIAVNDELSNLSLALAEALKILRPGARIVVISFHSLEDRIVKKYFTESEKGCVCPPKLPKCVCGRKPTLKVLTRKPVMPSKKEIESNPSARSAKMRVAERI
jgi:16S rRNA (cytosine1402-N4)-methyltransferase